MHINACLCLCASVQFNSEVGVLGVFRFSFGLCSGTHLHYNFQLLFSIARDFGTTRMIPSLTPLSFSLDTSFFQEFNSASLALLHTCVVKRRKLCAWFDLLSFSCLRIRGCTRWMDLAVKDFFSFFEEENKHHRHAEMFREICPLSFTSAECFFVSSLFYFSSSFSSFSSFSFSRSELKKCFAMSRY